MKHEHICFFLNAILFSLTNCFPKVIMLKLFFIIISMQESNLQHYCLQNEKYVEDMIHKVFHPWLGRCHLLRGK